MASFYRGGPSLAPRQIDVMINPKTGMVGTTRGVSVFDLPDGLDRFGGAYELGPIPETLQVIQRGRDPHHHEITPAQPMTFDEYSAELAKITLTPV
jgi:hypothetical protein